MIFSDNDITELSKLGAFYKDWPLSHYTSFKTGGLADYVSIPDSLESLQKVVCIAGKAAMKMTIIGGGSNLLISDRGLHGLVVVVRAHGESGGEIRLEGDGRLFSEAAVTKECFIDYCVKKGLAGTDFMAGIPGCLGGGIKMNAGTFMGNFIDILDEVVLVLPDGSVVNKKIDKNDARYRELALPADSLIYGAYFRMPAKGSVSEEEKKIANILADRAGKHPLEYPSAGSVFKNPEGYASWKLVNDSGLKGFRIGGAMVSTKHTNFIINYDHASSLDIYRLIKHVQQTVWEKFQVKLEPEIKMLGDFE